MANHKGNTGSADLPPAAIRPGARPLCPVRLPGTSHGRTVRERRRIATTVCLGSPPLPPRHWWKALPVDWCDLLDRNRALLAIADTLGRPTLAGPVRQAEFGPARPDRNLAADAHRIGGDGGPPALAGTRHSHPSRHRPAPPEEALVPNSALDRSEPELAATSPERRRRPALPLSEGAPDPRSRPGASTNGSPAANCPSHWPHADSPRSGNSRFCRACPTMGAPPRWSALPFSEIRCHRPPKP
jgi:hypothetical protein